MAPDPTPGVALVEADGRDGLDQVPVLYFDEPGMPVAGTPGASRLRQKTRG